MSSACVSEGSVCWYRRWRWHVRSAWRILVYLIYLSDC